MHINTPIVQENTAKSTQYYILVTSSIPLINKRTEWLHDPIPSLLPLFPTPTSGLTACLQTQTALCVNYFGKQSRGGIIEWNKIEESRGYITS